jgi:hypothetical protein
MDSSANRSRHAAARLTGFEDLNFSVNLGSLSKAAGQMTYLSKSNENLTLINNGGNGDSVPATVPASAPPIHCGSPIQAEVGGLVQG